ncbi:hypothetical protein [Nesterenkonia pannonica]|uniref:hypothetical protein n=1 Tax=Nesterenkonia pannonica TaxID=1548602 RepID=UPI0021646B90|nr:hypothetical protein [Nesterenkonia pannonica]
MTTSPRTGSAVPTVIDGLTRAAAREDGSPEQGVLIAEGTYSDRYPQVTCREYAQAPSPGRGRRVIDAAVGTVSGSRPFQRRELKPLLAEQGTWPPSTVIAHNLVQLIPLVDHTRHQAVLYAHNDLLRTYTQREAAAALAHVALIVCVSSFLAERLKRQLPGAMHRRVVVVPNAADCLQFTAAQEPRTRAAGEPLRVAYLGRVILQGSGRAPGGR